jgi:hypothetical protein
VRRDDVLDFLVEYESRDCAVKRWRESTRKKLAGNVLSALRDFGVLTGVQDWRLFLWEPHDTSLVLAQLAQRGEIRFERSGRIVVLDVPGHPLGDAR